MDNMDEYIEFVKQQAAFHERQVVRFATDDRRKLFHSSTAEKFSNLLQFLENLEQTIPASTIPSDRIPKLSLNWSEVENLPAELMAELSISESDKLDYSLVSLIKSCGGVATLDRILVSVYKLTEEIMKRATLNSRLYRMVQKGLIYSVPGKKGVYSTFPMDEDEASELT